MAVRAVAILAAHRKETHVNAKLSNMDRLNHFSEQGEKKSYANRMQAQSLQFTSSLSMIEPQDNNKYSILLAGQWTYFFLVYLVLMSGMMVDKFS